MYNYYICISELLLTSKQTNTAIFRNWCLTTYTQDVNCAFNM